MEKQFDKSDAATHRAQLIAMLRENPGITIEPDMKFTETPTEYEKSVRRFLNNTQKMRD